MKAPTFTALFCLVVSHISANDTLNDSGYHIGLGIADITGPAAEIGMMGYAKPEQTTGGIHTRLWSRAFIVVDSYGKRLCYVSADLAMVSQVVTFEVVKILKGKYSGLYTESNVMIAGTHTHSGPGGFLEYFLYIATSKGFVAENFHAIVNGIVASIDIAHSKMVPGYIFYNEGDLVHASINRSPTAYDNNPEQERRKYPHNTDKKMYLLKFTNLNREILGLFSWFAVHPTSMNNTNSLISGDNKGYASLVCEKHFNNQSLPGKGSVVCGFPNANLGDVSPNLKGPRCVDTGKACDLLSSTCGGKSQKCIAFGPGDDMFESTKIIGLRQFEKALELSHSSTQQITGQVKFVQQYVDMTKVSVRLPNGENAITCEPAMGYSFAAGTTDGPGVFDFRQGSKSSELLWNIVRDLISKPSKKLKLCHEPKPILIPTGQMTFPYLWQPSIVPTQLFSVGDLIIAGVPAEFTTMSGRRLKDTLRSILATDKVVLSGLTGAYSSYVATFEEYQIQRYEGASTIYGPHTLRAYLQQYEKLAYAVERNESIGGGPEPPNLLKKQISLVPPVIFDNSLHIGKSVKDAKSCYEPGQRVSVSFVSGHPRNNLMTGKTFLTVEKKDPDTSKWNVVATDGDWETKFVWKRISTLLGTSQAIIEWHIPADVVLGTYRVQHFGYYKPLLRSPKPYSGRSKIFSVVANCNVTLEANFRWQLDLENESILRRDLVM